jgi:hypothetical protein
MSEPVSDPLALPENYATKLKQVRSLIGPLHGVGYNEGVQAGYAAGWLEAAPNRSCRLGASRPVVLPLRSASLTSFERPICSANFHSRFNPTEPVVGRVPFACPDCFSCGEMVDKPTAVNALFRNCATLSLAADATAEQVPRRGRGEAQHHKESYQRK